MHESTRLRGELRVDRPEAETLLVRFVEDWSLQRGVASIADVRAQVDAEPRPQHLSLTIRRGDIFIIMGGSGKSTLRSDSGFIQATPDAEAARLSICSQRDRLVVPCPVR